MMHISIRKVFFNLRIMLLLLGAGVTLLTLQLFHISQYSDRLGALKSQHLLIDKIITTDLDDPAMASILINGAIAEMALSVKRSGEEALLDRFINSNEEQASLLRSLTLSSQAFQDNVLIWIESSSSSLESNRGRVMSARSAYLNDIDHMVDYQIHIIGESIATAKITALIVFFLGLFVFFFYSRRLQQIYHDIHRISSIDAHGDKKEALTREIDFALRRLARQSSAAPTGPNLTHPFSGLNNEKGMIAALNTKRSAKTGNTLFLCVFEIDGYSYLAPTLSDEERGAIFRKIGEIISFYEQPFDVIAQTEDDHVVFLLSRNTKNTALEECEHIVRSVGEAIFTTSRGALRITLSGGFLLKIPVKTVEEGIREGVQLIEKAKEAGGNRVAQLRDRADSFR